MENILQKPWAQSDLWENPLQLGRAKIFPPALLWAGPISTRSGTGLGLAGGALNVVAVYKAQRWNRGRGCDWEFPLTFSFPQGSYLCSSAALWIQEVTPLLLLLKLLSFRDLVAAFAHPDRQKAKHNKIKGSSAHLCHVYVKSVFSQQKGKNFPCIQRQKSQWNCIRGHLNMQRRIN